MKFNERLKAYRKELGLLKRELAIKLEVSESYYNMIENDKRNPSKTFLVKLALLSNKPEEYWLYGITNNNNIGKLTSQIIEQIVDLNLVEDVNSLFNGSSSNKELEELLIASIKTDIKHLLNLKRE